MRKKYELSFMYQGRIHFAIVRDDDVKTAAERVLCTPASALEFTQSETGTWFIKEPDGSRWSLVEVPEYEPPSEVIGRTKPHASETYAALNTDKILAAVTGYEDIKIPKG